MPAEIPDPLGGDVLAWPVDDLEHVAAERMGPVAVYTSPDAERAILTAVYGWWVHWEVSEKGTLIVRDPRRNHAVIDTHAPGSWGWIGHVRNISNGPGKEFN